MDASGLSVSVSVHVDVSDRVGLRRLVSVTETDGDSVVVCVVERDRIDCVTSLVPCDGVHEMVRLAVALQDVVIVTVGDTRTVCVPETSCVGETTLRVAVIDTLADPSLGDTVRERSDADREREASAVGESEKVRLRWDSVTDRTDTVTSEDREAGDAVTDCEGDLSDADASADAVDVTETLADALDVVVREMLADALTDMDLVRGTLDAASMK
jgi:hypothetical protein